MNIVILYNLNELYAVHCNYVYYCAAQYVEKYLQWNNKLLEDMRYEKKIGFEDLVYLIIKNIVYYRNIQHIFWIKTGFYDRIL